jgi:hypothetical protein
MRSRAVLVAIHLLAACAPPAPDGPLEIRSASAQPFTAAPGFDARVRAAAADGARWWGADPAILDGWSVVVVDGAFTCGRLASAGGCTLVEEREIRVSTDLGPCVGALPVAHEVGHVALWTATGDADARHADPRWAALASEISGRVADEGECPADAEGP